MSLSNLQWTQEKRVGARDCVYEKNMTMDQVGQPRKRKKTSMKKHKHVEIHKRWAAIVHGWGKCWMKQSARAPPNHLHLTLSPSHDMASPSPSHDIRPPSSFFFHQHNTNAVSWRLQKKLQFPAHTERGAQGCLSSYWSSPSPHAWHEGFFDNGPQFIQHASLRNWEKWRVWL